MLHMLCRNRVRDYAVWRRIFDEQGPAAEASGLRVLRVWRDEADANDVWFLFAVTDREAALAFVNDPANAEIGERAGVIDGEIRLVEEA